MPPQFGDAVPPAAARKGHGAISVGDIIGADVLNVSWIAGAAAVANPLVVPMDVVWFMFPSMLAIVVTMLVGLYWKARMTRGLGIVLMCMFACYAVLMFVLGVGRTG